MNFENIMLNERSQVQKASICMIHLYEMSRTGQSKETENMLVVTRFRGKREWRVTADGDELWFFRRDKNVLKLDSGDHYITR